MHTCLFFLRTCPPSRTPSLPSWLLERNLVFSRGTADMSRVSDYAFGMRSSVRSDRMRCTSDTVHAVVSNYRPVRRNLMITVLRRCLTHAYWEGTVVDLVDRASQGSITVFDAIINTSYMTSGGLRFRRRHRQKCHGVPALQRRSHVGLNWSSQAPSLQAIF